MSEEGAQQPGAGESARGVLSRIWTCGGGTVLEAESLLRSHLRSWTHCLDLGFFVSSLTTSSFTIAKPL